MHKKAAIIGSGLGGLSAAIRLASSGFEVHIYERNSGPGGKARSVNEGGFRFDTGPSLITMPFVIAELFESTGEDINAYLTFEKLHTLCKYFFPEGTIINAHSDTTKFADEIEAKTSDAAGSLFKYLDHCKRIYELTSDIFLFGSLHSLKSYLNLKALKTLLGVSKIDPFRTVDKANSAFFTDKKTIQIFNRYATYSGSNPFRAPATLNIIPHVECNLGGYFIKGGMYNLTLALERLAVNKGVELHYNSDVSKIETENNQVEGIIVSNQRKKYNIVVSNADVNKTYDCLLNDNTSKTAKRYRSLEPSSSAIVFYWGIKRETEHFGIHNILFSKDYAKEFDDLFNKKTVPDDPTVYMYASCKFNPDDAPKGSENWFVMINAPYNSGQDWPEEIKEARRVIIKKIDNLLDVNIDESITYEEIMGPVELEKQTGSYKGSIYGISSNSRRSAFMRHPNRSKQYRGLYFCGGSAHPGGGIPLVILSGKISAELILKHEK